jgi:hypothetical protein
MPNTDGIITDIEFAIDGMRGHALPVPIALETAKRFIGLGSFSGSSGTLVQRIRRMTPRGFNLSPWTPVGW